MVVQIKIVARPLEQLANDFTRPWKRLCPRSNFTVWIPDADTFCNRCREAAARSSRLPKTDPSVLVPSTRGECLALIIIYQLAAEMLRGERHIAEAGSRTRCCSNLKATTLPSLLNLLFLSINWVD